MRQGYSVCTHFPAFGTGAASHRWVFEHTPSARCPKLAPSHAGPCRGCTQIPDIERQHPGLYNFILGAVGFPLGLTVIMVGCARTAHCTTYCLPPAIVPMYDKTRYFAGRRHIRSYGPVGMGLSCWFLVFHLPNCTHS